MNNIQRSISQRRRKNLTNLVSEGRLRCEKHKQVIEMGTYYSKKCYASRNGEACPYLVIVKREYKK